MGVGTGWMGGWERVGGCDRSEEGKNELVWTKRHGRGCGKWAGGKVGWVGAGNGR